MNEAAIETAFQTRLLSMAAVPPIAWPNRDFTSPAGPYLVFDPVRVGRRDETLAGGGLISRGYVVVTVVSAANAFTGAALALADAVAAHFPYGLRLTITGGTIVIIKPPELLRGFTDTPDWRQPVRIDYEAAQASSVFADGVFGEGVFV